jgi:hypothetical protein
MAVIDHRPANGSGSCPRCCGSLGLASLKVDGRWYCSTDCAEGRVRGESRSVAVPEAWLYARPRRFFGRRQPKELNSTRAGE